MKGWKSVTSIRSLQCDDVLGKSPAASVGAGILTVHILEVPNKVVMGWELS
jgi:hypothetical protein